MKAVRSAAITAYLLCAVILGFRSPGLYYDEAIFFNGAVHMVNSGQEPAFAHDPSSWVTLLGRQWPIMVMPYVGAVRNYLAAIPFAAFGPNYYTARILSALLGVLGIWGFSVLICEVFDAQTAAATSWILAIHPGYLTLNIYQGSVGEWMLAFAALCIALARYLRAPSTLSAFWLGLAMGFGVWARANVVWLIASATLAAVLVLRKRIALPSRQLGTLVMGTIVGTWPLLWYEFRSQGATFQFMRTAALPDPLQNLILKRLKLFCEILLSGGELRKAWDGPAPPVWQTAFFTAAVASAALICFTHSPNSNHARQGTRRISVLTFLFLFACMLFSRLKISGHHMIALVPIAALIVVVAVRDLSRRWPACRYAAPMFAVTYAACALYGDMVVARRLRTTGGVGLWSNAIDSLSGYLQNNYRGREIKLLDWGLHNNLYVLANSRIDSHELFWGATLERSGSGKHWSEEISPGDVYVQHSEQVVVFPVAGQGFERALSRSGLPFRRTLFSQKNGVPYAEALEILPRGP